MEDLLPSLDPANLDMSDEQEGLCEQFHCFTAPAHVPQIGDEGAKVGERGHRHAARRAALHRNDRSLASAAAKPFSLPAGRLRIWPKRAAAQPPTESRTPSFGLI